MKITLKLQPGMEPLEINREAPLTLEELVKEHEEQLPYQILIARVNGKDEELTFTVEEDAVIELLDLRDQSASRVYQHTLSLIYLKAIMDVLGRVEVEIDNSLNKGLYTDIRTEPAITEEQVRAVEHRMRELVEADLPIAREVYSKEEALQLLEEEQYPEKIRLLRGAEEIKEAKFYHLEGYRNFFYGLMAPSTGYIEYFEVRKYRSGVLLRFPTQAAPDEVPAFVDDVNLYKAFGEAAKWQRLLDVSYLADLNQKLKDGKAKDLILLSEALHEKKIAEIADQIAQSGRRIILIAGPSSSGKTTFARRLCIQLRVNGLEPLYMGTDDYFINRKEAPLGPDGKPDYENLQAMDLELFNDNMNRLLAGEAVDLPEYDFLIGEKVFGHRITSIEGTQPIVIEGIHALNGKMTEHIADDEKFKIYISPFTQLNVDIHNRVPTTDARLLRRIVRDYQYRGYSAAATIAQWPKVRAGEDVNIFPYNGEADVLFNSALVYELAALKKYAEPLLESVTQQQPEYSEAARLLKFIRFFDVIERETDIPNNSIMREFIGGSIFVE